MKRKLTITLGALALLFGINMQVKALNPAEAGFNPAGHQVTLNPTTQTSLDEWMPDKNLQKALISIMGLKDSTKLTQEALMKFEGDLILQGNAIGNIQGLEYAHKTHFIALDNNQISDLGPLKDLTQLQKLTVAHNEVLVLDALANLSNMEYLDISYNKISDIAPIQDRMEWIMGINLDHNKVRDIKKLGGMPRLDYLYARDQEINNEELIAEAGVPIVQKNDLLTYRSPADGAIDYTPILKPESPGGVYDTTNSTMTWTFSTAGKKQAISSFDTTSHNVGVTVYFSGNVTQPIKVAGDATSLEVKDSTIYTGAEWKPQDNLVKATNKDDDPVDISGITVEGRVDTSKAGTYKVTYSMLNATNKKISKTATIIVKADQTSLEIKDSTLYVGDKWNPEDNLVRASDKDGNPVDLGIVSVEGVVDTSKADTYKVTYALNNANGKEISKVATVTVKADQTDLEVKDSTLYFGDTWQPVDNLVKALDQDGKAIDIKDITVEGQVDTAKAGTYQVKYTILNHKQEKMTKEATITVKGEDQTYLELKDTQLYIGDKWQAQDNLVKALDQDGKKIDIEDITVEGSVDTSKAGSYQVTYTILNHRKAKISKVATIIVKADQTALEVKDSILYFGDAWQPVDNLVKAVDKDGKAIDIKDISVEGQVDTTKAGAYQAKYTILNHKQEKLTKEATITVKGEDQTSLEVKDSTLYFGDTWQPVDNLVRAIDQDGKAIDIKDITVEGQVDTTKAGAYQVKYTILNHKKEKMTKEATITVKGEDQTSLEVKDTKIYIGDEWQAQDNLVKAVDKDGKVLDIKDITVEGRVDNSKEGTYQVTYTILNHLKAKISKTASITVKNDLTSIDVKDSKLYVDDQWQAQDNFVKATDQDGNAIAFADVEVKGAVDTAKAGTYQVTYSVTNHLQKAVNKKATITVVKDQASLEVKDSTLYLKDTWQPADNLVKAVDQDGKAIDIKDITVEGSVDSNKEGKYQVTYTILNHRKAKISKVATIIVKVDQTDLEVKDSVLYFGDTWQPADNLVKAVDKDGKTIEMKDIVVEGSADVAKEGTYKVTYTILNHKQEKMTKEAIITVKGEDQTYLEVKDSTLYFGDTWQPADNLVKAVDKDGKAIDIKNVDVEGSVDTTKAGTYQVKYTILNHKQEKMTKEATITVKGEDQTSLEVKDSILYFGDTWQPVDNLVKAVDKDGKKIDIKDISVEGQVDVTKAGAYQVKYTILNHKKDKITKEATITVKGEDQTSLEVKDSILYFGDTWQPVDNLVKAIDQDGKAIDIKDITVEGQVDTAKAGAYQVKYTILNHKKEKMTKEATITVKGEDQTSLEVKDTKIYIGDQWQPVDNLVKALDQDGKVLDIKDITVEGQVDVTKAGAYKVKYTILNHKREKISEVATITVKVDQTKLEVKNSILYIGDEWQPVDNLVKAIDQDGKAIDIKDIKVEGQVDTKTVGDYPITYTILNHKQEKISKSATVTLKQDLTYLEVKDSTLYLDDSWQPADNLVKAIDQDGKAIDIKDIKVEGHVDPKAVGEYPITYTILNHKQAKISKVATITLKEDLTHLKVQDSILYISDTWHPQDNLVEAIDQDGNAVNFSDIQVDGTVDTTQVGVYQITYMIFNHRQEAVSETANIEIRVDQASLEIQDTELYVGDVWDPADNIVKAVDQDGHEIEKIAIVSPQNFDEAKSSAQVVVEGHIDTRQEGVQKVTFSIFDHAHSKITKAVFVNVKLDKTSLIVKDTKIHLNDPWQPADNLVRAFNQDGQSLDVNEISVEGNVNTHKLGKYQVTYTILNHKQEKISKKAQIIVQPEKGVGKLPKTGYDMSIIMTLLGVSGLLGLASLYLSRKERKE